MDDFLIKLAKSPLASQTIKTLGLPIPLPQELRRTTAAWRKDLLSERAFVVSGFTEQGLDQIPCKKISLEDSLRRAESRYDGAIFDARALQVPGDLTELYSFFKQLSGKLKACARLVVVGATSEAPHAAAVQGALTGFVKSLAKEVAKRGQTVQLLRCAPDRHDALLPVLQFFMSDYVAFVSGQVIEIGRPPIENPPMLGPGRLKNKVAVVTGAARGIGYEISKALAVEGAHVVAVDLESCESELQKLANYVSGTALGCNITDNNAAKTIVDSLPQGHDKIDIIVHNAGVTRDKTLARMSPEWWQQVLDVNLGAILKINSDLLPNHISDHGRIALMSSIGGIAGNFGQTNYAATKSALVSYASSLASELSDRGITVNAVAPGFIETKMTESMPTVVREVARRFNALSQSGLPQDIAAMVTFLVSPCAAGISGQTIRVCGFNIVGA